MWYWYVIVAFVSVCFGFGLACLLHAASDADDLMEWEIAEINRLLERFEQEAGE